jgi:hypothetical protein
MWFVVIPFLPSIVQSCDVHNAKVFWLSKNCNDLTAIVRKREK